MYIHRERERDKGRQTEREIHISKIYNTLVNNIFNSFPMRNFSGADNVVFHAYLNYRSENIHVFCAISVPIYPNHFPESFKTFNDKS